MSCLWRNKQGVEYIFFRSMGIIGKYQKNQQKNRFFSKNGYKEGNRDQRIETRKNTNPWQLTPNPSFMAIKSTKVSEASESRAVAPTERETDTINENILRPKTLGEYIGQESIKKHL